jgi:hypothetical protein
VKIQSQSIFIKIEIATATQEDLLSQIQDRILQLSLASYSSRSTGNPVFIFGSGETSIEIFCIFQNLRVPRVTLLYCSVIV